MGLTRVAHTRPILLRHLGVLCFVNNYRVHNERFTYRRGGRPLLVPI